MTADNEILPPEPSIDSLPLPAGGFSSWLRQTRSEPLARKRANVACGTCIGCCTSSYFIHVEPDETETLEHIPRELLFPAPGLPEGHLLLGYDEKGCCPMLVDGKCSIYEFRPRTCRRYDCRVFPAAGIVAGGQDKHAINQRIGRWRFSYPSERDRVEHFAVQAAARFLRQHADAFPVGVVPSNPTQLAALAIEVYEVFVQGAPGAPDRQSTRAAIVEAILSRLRQSSLHR